MSKKPKYERPMLVSFDTNQVAAACTTGSIPGGTDPTCAEGGNAGLGCRPGSVAYSMGCLTGSTPQQGCRNGNSAYMGCNNGNGAITIGCWNGNNFGVAPCTVGTLYYTCVGGSNF